MYHNFFFCLVIHVSACNAYNKIIIIIIYKNCMINLSRGGEESYWLFR